MMLKEISYGNSNYAVANYLLKYIFDLLSLKDSIAMGNNNGSAQMRGKMIIDIIIIDFSVQVKL